MRILQAKATREEWLQKIYAKSHSTNSRNVASLALKKWDEFLNHINTNEADVFHEIRSLKDDTDFYLFLDRFIQYLNTKQISASTVKIVFAMIKSWLRTNGIRIHNEDVKQFITFPKRNKEIKKPLSIDAITALVNNSSKTIKALLLTLTSSGMRMSEALQLRVTDFDFTTNPVMINIRPQTTKTREGRIAFISSEATDAVKQLLANKNFDDTVFIRGYTKYSASSIELRFQRLRQKCGLTTKYENGLYHVNIHAFRAFFHTEATKILGGDIAHAMIGHHDYLDQYFRMSDKERIEMYRKLEPYVTVSAEYRQKIIIEEKDRQIAHQNHLDDEVEKLKAKIYRMEKGLK